MNNLEEQIRNINWLSKIEIVETNNKYKIVQKGKELTDYYPLKELVYAIYKNDSFFATNKIPKEAFSDEFIKNYGIELIEYVGKIPEGYENSEYLFNYCLMNNKYEYLLQFKDIRLQNQILSNVDKSALINIIKQIIDNIPPGTWISYQYEDSILLFEYCINNKRYDIVNEFRGKEIEEYATKLTISDELATYISNSNYISKGFQSNKSLFQHLVTKGRWDVIVNAMSPKFITNEFLAQYVDKVFDELDWDIVKKRFYDNEAVLNYILIDLKEEEYKDVELDSFEIPTIISCLNDYGDKIINILLANNLVNDGSFNYDTYSFVSNLYSNEKFFEYVLANNYKNMINYFDKECYTDEIISMYKDELVDMLIDKDTIELPNYLKNNREILDKCFEKKAWILAFSSNILNEQDFEKYFNAIMICFKVYKDNEINFNYQNSSKLLEVCLKKGEFRFIDYFSSNAFNSDLIVPYFQDIINYYGINIYNDKNILCSSKFFKYCLDNNYYEIINRFKYTDSIENIIETNFDKITDICKVNIPEFFFASPNILKYFVSKQMDDLILKFKYRALDGIGYDEEDNKCLNYIVSLIDDKLPIEFTGSFRLFRYYIDKDDFSHIEEFHKYVFGDKPFAFLSDKAQDEKKYLISVLPKIMSKIGSKLPLGMKESQPVFDYCLDNNLLEMLLQFDYKYIVILYDKIPTLIEAIDTYNDSNIPITMISSNFLLDDLVNYSITNNRYDLLEQLPFSIETIEEIQNGSKGDLYEKVLGISKDVIYHKLKIYSEKNDEVLNTILPFMFSKKMECFKESDIEKIIIYPDLQQKLYKLDEHTLVIISKIISIINNDKYDLTGVLVKVLNNISTYHNLLDSIDINNVTDEVIKNLILIIQKNKNIYNIESMDDLLNINLESKIDTYYKQIENKIRDNSITLEELKESILEKRFGLSLKDTEFLIERYCHDMNMLENSSIDKKIFNILNSINLVYSNDDLDELKYLYITSKRTIIDFYTITSLESSIRASYAKMYSDSLYKLKEEHKLTSNHELYNSNRKVYDLINNSKYKNIHPDIYIMDGDFNLQIHALGAYRDWNVPDNFKEDWERPKIAYHGICTSFIGNNQIANARTKHPIYGFSNYEDSALLCAGNYDLFSDTVISSYDTGYRKPYNMYPPKEMIDNTRHTHNEMVLERRNNTNSTNFKRLPNYIVYIVDDINNEENFQEDNQLYQETLQASIDQGIPIVIVDRLKYAKSEKIKCDNLVQEFYITKDYKKLEEMVLTYSNNMIGCQSFDNEVKEYNQIFNNIEFNKYIDNIMLYVPNEFTKEEIVMIYQTLINSVKKETEKGSNITLTHLEDMLKKLTNTNISDNSFLEESVDRSLDKKAIITKFYYSQSDDIKQLIYNDIKNKISEDEIIFKINNNKYVSEEFYGTGQVGYKK